MSALDSLDLAAAQPIEPGKTYALRFRDGAQLPDDPQAFIDNLADLAGQSGARLLVLAHDIDLADVTEHTEQVRRQAFADARDCFARARQCWIEDGGRPDRVRILGEVVEALDAYAAGTASPMGPATAYRQQQEDQ